MSEYPPGWDLEMALGAAEIARAFHETYEDLAPRFSYQTRKASAVPWPQVPERNKQLMVATIASLVERGVISLPSPRKEQP